jgi:glycosyltransferase involved in cell wall biosynthesis
MKNKKSNVARIAIFHDFFGSIGGGEKLVLELAHSIGADIITTALNEKNVKRINNYNVKIISLGKCIQFPILKQIHSSIKFYRADFPDYDYFIMTGNWAVFAARKHRPNLYYIFTPVRMFYHSREFFYKTAPWYAKIPFILWVNIHKFFFERQLKYVDEIVTISRTVQHRVSRYFHRRSRIVYPAIKKYTSKRYGDYWLSVNRIYPHKRVELQIEAFRHIPKEKLFIVGGYMKGDYASQYATRILKNLPPNVKYLGEVDEKTLERLYAECKAFITTAKDEDFGMTALEANSAGKAVIATNEGGHKETVKDGRTGFLVKPHITEIVKAIKKLAVNPEKYKEECFRQAEIYSVKNFIKKMKEILNLRRHPGLYETKHKL